MRNTLLLALASVLPLSCGDGVSGLVGDERGLILYSKQLTHAGAEIWTARPDGGGARQLTSNNYWDGEADWSPDGRRIVFASEADSNPIGYPYRFAQVHVMNADGSNVRKLTTDRLSASRNPRWSPDGTRIAFNLLGTSRVRIYVMNADGSNLRPVTPPEGGDYIPDWSPDGSKIVYISGYPPESNARIYTINLDGTGAQMIGGDAACSGNARDATWSPDGARILYSCDDGTHTAIYSMKVDGSDVRRMSQPHASGSLMSDFSPAWSPDGRRVAFSSLRPQGTTVPVDVYTMSADGGEATRITADEPTDIVSDWKRRP